MMSNLPCYLFAGLNSYYFYGRNIIINNDNEQYLIVRDVYYIIIQFDKHLDDVLQRRCFLNYLHR